MYVGPDSWPPAGAGISSVGAGRADVGAGSEGRADIGGGTAEGSTGWHKYICPPDPCAPVGLGRGIFVPEGKADGGASEKVKRTGECASLG